MPDYGTTLDQRSSNSNTNTGSIFIIDREVYVIVYLVYLPF